MQSQRGSVTVIAIAMLLFLMLIAVAWLPMMTMEKTAASSDYREQQAWYAAEAGYKRAVAQLEAGNTLWKDWLIGDNNLKDGTFSVINGLGGEQQSGNEKLAGVLENGIWYAVAIFDTSGMDLKHGERDDDGNYTPVQGETYSITSIGSCDGIRKVIRKTYTLGDNGGTSGGDGDEGKYLEQSLIYAGSKVNVHGGNQSITLEGGSIVSQQITGNDKWQGNTEIHEVNGDDVKKFLSDMRTEIKNQVLDKSSYPKLEKVALEENLNIPENKQYYLEGNSIKGNITGSYNSLLFISSTQAKYYMTSWGMIKGPVYNSDKKQPFTIIYNGPAKGELFFNTNMSGDIKIISNVNIVLQQSSQYSNGLGMFLSNGDIKINCLLSKVFISSNQDVYLDAGSGLTGQIQAWNSVTLEKLGNTLKFSDDVLKKYGFPKELIANTKK